MAEIALKIEIGFTGGAPPHRRFIAKQNYEIKISPDAKMSVLKQQIEQLAPECRVDVHALFRESTKSVTEVGLVDGSVLQIQNGMKD